jgi:hypothetical protein
MTVNNLSIVYMIRSNLWLIYMKAKIIFKKSNFTTLIKTYSSVTRKKKYTQVSSYFEAFVKANIMVQLNFNLIVWL